MREQVKSRRWGEPALAGRNVDCDASSGLSRHNRPCGGIHGTGLGDRKMPIAAAKWAPRSGMSLGGEIRRRDPGRKGWAKPLHVVVPIAQWSRRFGDIPGVSYDYAELLSLVAG
jgi:hypothetical protein